MSTSLQQNETIITDNSDKGKFEGNFNNNTSKPKKKVTIQEPGSEQDFLAVMRNQIV